MTIKNSLFNNGIIRILFLIVLLGLIFSSIFLAAGYVKNSKSEKSRQSVQVKNEPAVQISRIAIDVLKVSSSNETIEFSSSGNLSPAKELTLISSVTGSIKSRISKLEVGNILKKGQFLMEIDASDHQRQLKAAQSNLKESLYRLEIEKKESELAVEDFLDIVNDDSDLSDLGKKMPQIAWREAKILEARENISFSKKKIGESKVYAPFNAIVTERQTEKGMYVKEGGDLLTLEGTDFGWVRSPLSVIQSIALEATPSKSLEITVSIPSLNIERKAKLLRNEKVVDQQTRSINQVLQIKDPYNLTKAYSRAIPFGTYLNIKYENVLFSDVISIPESAIINNRVFVVSTDDIASSREIKIIHRGNGKALIGEGLSQGEEIALNNLNLLVDGSKVRRPDDQINTPNQR